MSTRRAKVSVHCGPGGLLWLILSLATAIIGKHIHGSIFWAVIDFFFMPFAWLKWLICQEVSVSVIKGAFDWFLR